MFEPSSATMLRSLSVLFVVSILSNSAFAATTDDAARAEGEVVLYSSLNNEQIVTLIEAFKKKFPAIKPSFYRGTSERVLQRANTEAKAGRFAVDVVTSAGFQVQLMKESGLTQRYVPPEAAIYDEGFKECRRPLGQRPFTAQFHGLQHSSRQTH